VGIVSMKIKLPLDSDSFLRRECPFCKRHFKVMTTEEDRQSLVERELQAYLLQQGIETETESLETNETSELWCPYCGQEAPSNHWWTQEQCAYINIFAYNIAAQIINKELGRLKRSTSRSQKGLIGIDIKFEFKEMPIKTPWISPETDDMTLHLLPCCESEIKLLDGWRQRYYCYYCGFPHSPASA
jgi:hypothetical protein